MSTHSPSTASASDIQDMSYDQALAEVEEILRRLESDTLPIDHVLAESRRAVALIAHCRAKIKGIGREVEEILSTLTDETDRQG